MQSAEDRAHVARVEAISTTLAKERHLSQDLARSIARYHDIGRDEDPCKGHAKRGHDYVLRHLKGYKKKDLKCIASAILDHSNKNRISTPYAELIKDSDAYAHALEGEPLKPSEKLRLAQLHTPAFQPTWANADLQGLFDIQRRLLDETLKDRNSHKARITLRTLRTLLRFSKNGKDLSNRLKDLFQALEKSRQLDVVLHAYPDQVFTPGLQELRDLEREKLDAYLGTLDLTVLTSFVFMPVGAPEKTLKRMVKSYIKTLENTDINDVDQLHTLRIQGKRLKYLMGLGLITHAPEHFALIKSMHDLIGECHDTHDFQQFFKAYFETYPLTSELDRVHFFQSLNQADLNKLNALEPLLFQMRLLTQRSFL